MAQAHQVRRLGQGGRINHTPGSAVAAGDVVVTNGLFAFSTQPLAAGVLGTLHTAGGPPLIRVVKANGGISVGDAMYWDDDGDPQGGTAGTGCVATTATNNTFIGRCVAAAGATDETVDVELSIGVITGNNLENAVTDPGNAGAIPVAASGHCAIVTAGAETRTLAAPSFVGQQLLIYMKTDAGNCVITCTTTLNETGNDTITLQNTGESVYLIAVEEGANLRWRTPMGSEAEALLSTA